MPIAISDLVKYPFLPQARRHIAETELEFKTLVELPVIRDRAKQRIYDAMAIDSSFYSKPSRDDEVEIASYPVALLYLACIADKKLIERFALFEAEKIKVNIRNDEDREDVITEIARSFKWEVKTLNDLPAIHFSKFLSGTSKGRLSHDPHWKLVNRALKAGWVLMNCSKKFCSKPKCWT